MGQDLIGAAVGNYRIVGVLGEGGMGTVYRAVHPELGRTVAIKVLDHSLSHSSDIVRRFRVEARAVNHIRHPNITDIQDFGTLPDGRPYYVMEFLAGESLGHYLTRLGRLSARDTLVIMLPLTEALAAAHARGVVHRDLKPDNIFLVGNEAGPPTPKLLDFGIAKVIGDTLGEQPQTQTKAGAVMGTPLYMSPEQAAGRVDALGTASDVYSLGVIIYQMLAGAPPFDSPAFGELLIMHMQQPPPSLAARVAGLPHAIEELVMRMLSKEPAARPPDADAVRRELAAIARALELDARQPLERSLTQIAAAETIHAASTLGSLSPGQVGRAPTIARRAPVLPIAIGAVVVAGATFAILQLKGASKPAAAPIAVDAAVVRDAAVPADAPADAPRAVDAAVDAAMDAALPETEFEKRLSGLKSLFDDGLITKDEYEAKRAKLVKEHFGK